MSTNCERRRDLGAVQLAEATSSYSTSAVSCCAHSEQLNMSRSQPGVPVRAMSYSRIARPQLGHAGVLPTGCSGDLNKLNWGIAPLLALPTNSQQRNLFRDWFCHGLREQLAGAHVRFGSKADMCNLKGRTLRRACTFYFQRKMHAVTGFGCFLGLPLPNHYCWLCSGTTRY